MRTKTKLLVAIGALFVLFMIDFSLVCAEEQLQDNMPIIREALRANKKLFIAENMDLTVKETNEFWALYDKFQSDLEKIGDRYLRLIETYAKNYDTLSDADALKLLKERLALDEEYQKLNQSYLPKFMKILPGKKVTRYYQLENKFFAVVKYDLAKQIPLVK
jgi:hypothetical protein